MNLSSIKNTNSIYRASTTLERGNRSIETYPTMTKLGKTFSKSFENQNPYGLGFLNGNSLLSTFDKSNNNFNNCVQTVSSGRVPEIQMINKLYGLVPKKFIINERVRPETAVATRRSSTRSRPNSTTKYSKSGHKLTNSRQASLNSNSNMAPSADDNRAMTPSSSEIHTPLVTRRMSFEKNYFRIRNSKSASKTTASATQAFENTVKPHRVIHIDLNRMRWTDEDGNSGDETKKTPEESQQLPDMLPSSQSQPKSVPTPNSNPEKNRLNSLRKTISFDEDTLRHETEKSKILPESSKKVERPATAKQSSLKEPVMASSAVTSELKIPSGAIVVDKLPGPEPTTQDTQYWTAGKSTAERRAKLQKSFSIHPSMDSSFDSCYGFGVESENDASKTTNYPDSMKRVGRRSLHVETPYDEVDTLLSQKNKGNGSDGNRAISGSSGFFSRSMSMLDEPPSSSSKLSSCHLSSVVIQNSTTSLGTNSKIDFTKRSAEERRACLRKSMSLSEKETLDKNNGKNTSPTISSTKPTLIRSSSLQKSNHTGSKMTNRNMSNDSSDHGGTKGNNRISNNAGTGTGAGSSASSCSNSKIIIKKPILDIMTKPRLRPKTAPTHHHDHSHHKRKEHASTFVGNNGSSVEDKRNGAGISNQNRRQPMKARLQFPMSNASQHPGREGGVGVGTELGGKAQGEDKTNAKIESEVTTSADMKKVSWENAAAAAEDKNDSGNPVKKSFKSLRSLPSYIKMLQQPRRKSLSVDDDSLLRYSTSSISANNTQDENLLPCTSGNNSCKKREECLKIYEKMMKIGCTVRLQTIFRGMMSPVEYREFITAADAAAAESEAVAILTSTEIADNQSSSAINEKESETHLQPQPIETK